jgi:hypothetical protein
VDPGGERPQAEPERQQIIDDAVKERPVPQHQEYDERPPREPAVQRCVERDRAARHEQHRKSDEQPSGVLHRQDPGERRHDQIHGEVRQQPPLDGIKFSECPARVPAEDRHPGKMVEIVLEVGILHQHQREKRHSRET